MNPNLRERPHRRALMTAGLVSLAAVLGAVVGAIAAARGQRPADTHGPRLQTTDVVRTTVATTASFHGTVGFVSGLTVSDPGGGTITGLPTAGTTVHRGDRLYWVDDQPVVVFYGDSALFRTLRLPSAPRRASHQSGPPASVLAAQETLRTARQQLAADRETLNQAETLQQTDGRSALLQAGAQLRSDRAALAAARSQLGTDRRLGCPAASSTTVGSPSAKSGASSSTGSGSGTGASTGSISTQGTGTAPQAASGSGTTAVRGAHNDTATTDAATATTTTPFAPAVADETDSGETTTTAVLSAQITPDDADTRYYVEYGPTMAYGIRSPTVDAGAGADPVQVSVTLGDLRPGTTYVYAIVASNSHGTATGVRETFATPASSCVEQRQTLAGDRRAITQDLLALRGTRASVGSATATDRGQLRADQAAVRADVRALRWARDAVPPARRRAPQAEMSGADVALVAQNLAALGYYRGSTAGASTVYTPALAAAVRRWQAASGIVPTGALAADQVLVLPGPARISAVHGTVGGHADAAVLSLSGATKLVSFSGSGDLHPGESVQVSVQGGAPVGGRILRVRPDGSTLAVQASVSDPGALPASGPAEVSVTTASHPNVLAVPVEALVALPGGGYALQLAGGYRLAVHVGLISGDRAEVSGQGLHAGMQVVTAA